MIDRRFLLHVGVAGRHAFADRHREAQLRQLGLPDLARGELDEGPGGIGVFRRGRDHKPRAVHPRRTPRRAFGQGGHVEGDTGGGIVRHRPVARDSHRRNSRQEPVIAILRQLAGRRHRLVVQPHRADELEPRRRLRAVDQGLARRHIDDVPAVGPDHAAPERLLIIGLGPEAPLVGLPVAILVQRQRLRRRAQVVPRPILGRIGDPGGVEHRLVVVKDDGLEIARQAEIALGGLVRLQRHREDAVQGRGVGVKVRCQVQKRPARLPVGIKRRVHREDVRRGAARDEDPQLFPVAVPVRDLDLDGDVGMFGMESLGHAGPDLALLRAAPQLEGDLGLGPGASGGGQKEGGRREQSHLSVLSCSVVWGSVEP